MTTDEFLTSVQEYYLRDGATLKQWPAVPRGIVRQWLAKKSDRGRDMIFAELVKSFSARWGKPPGIAELEEADRAANIRAAEELEAPTYDVVMIEEREVEQSEAAQFLSGMLRAMKAGTHPSTYYERWERGGDT